jgi:hypothetical protein
MIAKRTLRSPSASSFARLGAYLLSDGASQGNEPAARILDYILGQEHPAGRVGTVRFSNCASESAELAIKEILATQALNTRAKGDRTYHLVASFAPGEQPSREQLEDIETELCAAIGLGAHQRISADRIDTAHLHLHVAINKIHPESFRSIEPYYDKRRLMEACGKLEIRHRLARTNHGRGAGRRPDGKAADLEAHTAEISFLTWLKETLEKPPAALFSAGGGWRDLHELLARHGVELRKRGAGLVLRDVRRGITAKASAVNPALSMQALTARLGPYQRGRNAISTKQSYERAPLRRDNTSKLYADYTVQREKGLEAKRLLHADFEAKRNAIYESFARLTEAARRSGATRQGKRSRYSELHLERTRELTRLRDAQKAKRAECGGLYHFNWLSYLRAQAGHGDVNAVSALRSMQSRRTEAQARYPAAKNADQAKTIMSRALSPAAPADIDIVARNNFAHRLSYVYHHRAWTPDDAGAASYQGRRRMKDGTQAMLFQRDAVMLVKPITKEEAERAERWRVGTEIVLSRDGSILARGR